MTDAADDFDALFEEVSSQRTQPTPAPPPVVASADDDFEALFDQMTDQRSDPPPTASNLTNSDKQSNQPENKEEIVLDPVATENAVQVVTNSAALVVEQNDKPMYERLGGIVRLLHDSLRELGFDKALNDASTQISDAQDRLQYVATLTEQAANKVLNTLDEGMPAQDVLSKKAKEMESRWASLFSGKLSIEEFKVLAGDSKQFASFVNDATEKEKARLLEIMMAQDFQDITGQLIKKVVTITKLVEHELAELLRDNAPPAVREKLHPKPVQLMQGPSVPTAAMDQTNVDDLLADLGF